MSPVVKPEIQIIVKKARPVRHGAHHGGAWKVAYADFVTAMMALFIVLWLMSANDRVKKAIGAYFRDPTGAGRQLGSGAAGSGEGLSVRAEDMSQLKERIQAALMQAPRLRAVKDHLELTITGEGLRIELIETESGFFFESGNSNPTPVGQELLSRLASELGHLENSVLVEGHTDSRPYSPGSAHTNWELSADRANAARRLMEASGVRAGQIGQVRGFADRRLRDPKHPESASNRRVSVIVQNQDLKVETSARLR